MSLPAGQGLSVLYVLADQWLRERQTVAGLGAEPGLLDDLVTPGGDRTDTGRAERARALGGEVVMSHGTQDR